MNDASKVSLAGALISQASVGSDVRFEKVASLRQSIAAEIYSVPAEDIAEKLMAELRRKGPKPVE